MGAVAVFRNFPRLAGLNPQALGPVPAVAPFQCRRGVFATPGGDGEIYFAAPPD